MNKTNLLKNIQNDTYCRLKSSKVSGIGVVAIKDIPANTNPFYLTNKTFKKNKFIKILKKDLKNTNLEVLKIIDDCKDKEWFFDTELLYKAEKNNLSICEVPVTWVDDKDSSVNLISTIINDLIGLIRLRLGK